MFIDEYHRVTDPLREVDLETLVEVEKMVCAEDLVDDEEGERKRKRKRRKVCGSRFVLA